EDELPEEELPEEELPEEELPEEPPEEEPPDPLLVPAPGMLRLCPTRIRALEPRLLAEMMAPTVVLYRAARWLTVSPARTVWVPAALLEPEEEPDDDEPDPLADELPEEEFEPEDPEELLAEPDPGMVRLCPIRIRALEPRPSAEMIARSVVPCRLATDQIVPPSRPVLLVP